MSEMSQLELQNHLQKQQQVFQMMSNISKSMHDTAKNVIQNIKG